MHPCLPEPARDNAPPISPRLLSPLRRCRAPAHPLSFPRHPHSSRHHDTTGNDRPPGNPGSADPLLSRSRPPGLARFRAALREQCGARLRGFRRAGRQPRGNRGLPATGDVGDARHAAHDLDVAGRRRRRRRNRAHGRPGDDDLGRRHRRRSRVLRRAVDRDLLVRTECGWRIQSRMQERSWMHNAPPVAVR